MAKYIEAEEIKRIIRANDWSNKAVPLAVGMIIDRVPAADAVEVVRCKDCGYCYPICRLNGTVYVYQCEYFTSDVDADDFCSNGERK